MEYVVILMDQETNMIYFVNNEGIKFWFLKTICEQDLRFATDRF